MLKFIALTAALSAALSTFWAEVAFSVPLSVATTSPVDEPICYLQTTDGRIINLSRLCEKSPNSSLRATTLSPEEQLPAEEWRGSDWLNMKARKLQ